MKRIYKGVLRDCSISHLEIRDGNISKFEFQTPVIKEDILFYEGLFGVRVSFDFMTRLPDYAEATDYIKDWTIHSKNPLQSKSHCVYADPTEMKYDRTISREEFKQLKKRYQEARKRK